MICLENCFFDVAIMLIKLYSLKLCMILHQKLKISCVLNTFVLGTAKLAGFPLIITRSRIYIQSRANLPLPELFNDVIRLLTVSEGTVIILISIEKEIWFFRT
jgi:hypothetical protein